MVLAKIVESSQNQPKMVASYILLKPKSYHKENMIFHVEVKMQQSAKVMFVTKIHRSWWRMVHVNLVMIMRGPSESIVVDPRIVAHGKGWTLMVLVRYAQTIKGFKIMVKHVDQIHALQVKELLLVVIVKRVNSFIVFQRMVNISSLRKLCSRSC